MSGHGWTLLGASLALAAILVAIAVIDFKRLVIPDHLNLALAAAGVGFQLSSRPENVQIQMGYAALTLAAFWAIRRGHFLITGRIGLGLGDVKMLGASAVWINPFLLPILLFVASVAALLLVGWQTAVSGSAAMRSRIPFGPFIALGLGCTWSVEQFFGFNLDFPR